VVEVLMLHLELVESARDLGFFLFREREFGHSLPLREQFL
jgi:hypothetical protein